MYSYVCNCKVVLTVNLLLLLLVLRDNVLSLTVDNQLVSARNDCFERIALEAMLPFERSFHTEDTNSLKTCKEKCIQAGDKCQTIAFGVHRRGNGTCQLSAEKLGMSGGRPGGTIFDPDFDLYSRKTNCFDLSDNMIPVADAMAYDSTLPSQTPPQVQYTSSHMESGSPLWLMVNPTTNPTTTTMKTTTMTADDRFPAMTTFFSSGGGG